MPFFAMAKKYIAACLKLCINAFRRVQPRWIAAHSCFGLPAGIRNLGVDKNAPGEIVRGSTIIFSSWEAVRCSPVAINETQISVAFRNELLHAQPASGAVALKNGRLLGKEGLAFDADGFIIADGAKRIAGPPYDWRELYSPIRSKPKQLKGTWGALTGCGSSGFYHWMMDILPKVQLIEALVPQIDRWIVPKCDYPFVEQSLDFLQVPQTHRYLISDAEQIIADTLVVASNPAKSGNPPRWAVDFLRERFAPPSTPTGSGDRIYISRAKAKVRRITNETELLKILMPLGYSVVHLESLSISEQAKLFQTASQIVSPHGAGLSNLVHASPKTRVLEIFASKYVNVCFWALANHLNLKYSYVVGASDGDLSGVEASADITLSEYVLERISTWADGIR